LALEGSCRPVCFLSRYRVHAVEISGVERESEELVAQQSPLERNSLFF
jgi:hypothetical protein